jgi:WD40 repeat protein
LVQGTVIQVLSLDGGPMLRLAGHCGQVAAACFVDDGSRIASIGDDGTVRLWDAAHRRDIDLIRAEHLSGPTAAAATSQDGARALVADAQGHAAVIDVRSRTAVRIWNAGFPVSAAALSADGSFAALGSTDGRTRIWSVDSGYVAASLPQIKSAIRCLAFSPDHLRLAAGAQDGRVRVHDLENGQELFACHGHIGPVLHVMYGQRHVRTGGADGTIRTFTSRNGERIATDSSHDDPVLTLAVGSQHGAEASAHGPLITIAPPSAAGPSTAIRLPHDAQALCFDAQETLLYAATANGIVRCIDVASGRTLLTIRDLPSPALALAASDDRDVVAVLADGSVAVITASR